MIPTDEEMQAVRQAVEAAAGMDDVLKVRCGPLMRMGAFDEAVRNAFVLLEERLRSAVSKDGLTGVPLANHAFAPDGLLAKQLGHTPVEREGLRELYSGAFKLFRNPAAHGVVGYNSSEGKSIIGLVNLLLLILSRADEVPPPDLFPANVEAVFSGAEKLLGIGTAAQLRTFIGKCIKAGLKPQASPKQWIPFRRHALIQYDHWQRPKPYPLTVFYLVQTSEIGLWFPVNQYYRNVKGLSLAPIHQGLKKLGFTPSGKTQDYDIVLHSSTKQPFFDALFEFIAMLSNELDTILQSTRKE